MGPPPFLCLLNLIPSRSGRNDMRDTNAYAGVQLDTEYVCDLRLPFVMDRRKFMKGTQSRQRETVARKPPTPHTEQTIHGRCIFWFSSGRSESRPRRWQTA